MNGTKEYRMEEDLEKLKGDLKKLLVEVPPAYVSGNRFREKLIAAIKTLEEHRPDKETQR